MPEPSVLLSDVLLCQSTHLAILARVNVLSKSQQDVDGDGPPTYKQATSVVITYVVRTTVLRGLEHRATKCVGPL